MQSFFTQVGESFSRYGEPNSVSSQVHDDTNGWVSSDSGLPLITIAGAAF